MNEYDTHDSPHDHDHDQDTRRDDDEGRYQVMNGDGQDQTNLPHYLTGFSRGKPSHFYVNGDIHFTAKKIVLNPRHFKDFNQYLDFLTDKINPPFGAVRQICTPQHGHRVKYLNDLQPGGSYVVIGNGRFRPYAYDQITSTERRRSPPRNYDADPVIHSKVYRSSGRVKKTTAHSKIIKVSANGKGQQGPRVVLLSWRVPWTLPNIISQVDDILRKDCEGSVERLYLPNGIQVMDIDQINHMGHYVALRKIDHFKKSHYLDRGVKGMQVSPRLSDGRFHLEPLFPRSHNSTSYSSPDHSNASTQNGSLNGNGANGGYSRSRLKPKRRDQEESQVFPAKPIKHTRSSEKRQPVDLDKDEGGKFKAKQRNYNTAGAREVQDTRHTKVDVPIDQQEARTVEDEKIKRRERNKSMDESDEDDNPRPRPEQKQEPHQQHQRPPPQRNDQPRGGVQSKPNSKRPSPPAATSKNNKDKDNDKATDHLKYRDEEIRRHKAATTIQAGYRGYRVRKNRPLRRKNKTPERSTPPRRERTLSRTDTFGDRLGTGEPRGRQTPQSLENSKTNDFDELDKAATKIQSNYRGYITRKKLKAERAQKDAQKRINDVNDERYEKENEAATKIQAGFKGYKVRKDKTPNTPDKEEDNVKDKDQTKETPVQQSAGLFDDDDDDLDDNFDKAAIKIQSSYRGYRVRKDLEDNRGTA